MIKRYNYLVSIAILIFWSAGNTLAPAQDPSGRAYTVDKTTGPVRVDGVLSEQIWEEVDVASGFWMSYPVDDRRADESRQTEVRLTSDREYLYVAAVCYGPDNYVIKTLKRDTDFNQGDGFGVVLDPVNERTNGYTFGVNPEGVQTEFLFTSQIGRRKDPEPGRLQEGINLAWDNKWFVEVTSYPDRWVAEIAIPFKSLRFDAGKDTWGINFFRLDAGSNSIHTWSPVPIEFWEYDMGYTGRLIWNDPPEKTKSNVALIPYIRGGMIKDFEAAVPAEYEVQPGLDAKIPVTSSLSLDVTLNPDFSQVEVDEQIVNLTLFDIQLPEKRLFFLENSDIFEDFGIPPMRPFFSRRIGLDERGNPISILYGARLSGNVNQDLRIGLMNLQTRESDEVLSQNFTVFSFHQQVLTRSVIRGYLHNRSALNGEDPDYNRNIGLEFQYRSVSGRTEAFGGYAKSFSPALDSKDYFFNAGFGYDNRHISVYSNLSGLGENYKADLGYIRGQRYYDASRDTAIHIGMNHWFSRFSYTFYPESGDRIISHELNSRYSYDFDTDFNMLLHEVWAGYALKFASTGSFQATYKHYTVNLLFPFTFIGQEPLPSGIYGYDQAELRYLTDQRRIVSFEGTLLYGTFYNGKRIQYRLGVKLRAQPWGNFALNFEQNDLKFPDPYGEGNLFLISPRIEFNFSKALFWTTFLQYDTQNDNFNINSRFQWRFQPMSDLYIVYTDNYAVEFWGPKNRALVVKLNYWFNF